jgi:hypothetical protein
MLSWLTFGIGNTCDSNARELFGKVEINYLMTRMQVAFYIRLINAALPLCATYTDPIAQVQIVVNSWMFAKLGYPRPLLYLDKRDLLAPLRIPKLIFFDVCALGLDLCRLFAT